MEMVIQSHFVLPGNRALVCFSACTANIRSQVRPQYLRDIGILATTYLYFLSSQ